MRFLKELCYLIGSLELYFKFSLAYGAIIIVSKKAYWCEICVLDEYVLWSISHFFKKFWNSTERNWDSQSVINCQAGPHLANMFFIFLMIFVAAMVLRLSIWI